MMYYAHDMSNDRRGLSKGIGDAQSRQFYRERVAWVYMRWEAGQVGDSVCLFGR